MSTLFVDIDTQLDFLYPAGALYVPGAEGLLPTLASLAAYASGNGIPVVSTVDAHTEDDPEFRTWPRHCVGGAIGQHKAEATLLARRVVLPNREGDLAIEGAQQIVVEKQTIDAFQTHTFGRLIRKLNPDRLMVYGVVTEICVLHAVLGLLALGKRVAVITDAIRSLTPEASAAALEEMGAAGAELVTAAQVLVVSH